MSTETTTVLNPITIHLNEFVTDSSNTSDQWLFRKLMISYDEDIGDVNTKVFESGDLSDDKNFIFLCVSQDNQRYERPFIGTNQNFFVSKKHIKFYILSNRG